jgi:hypothetical protein
MATKTEGRRSWLMGLLRVSAIPLLLACLVGGVLMAVSLGHPHEAGTSQALWEAGCNLLALAGGLFIALLWGGVYLMVVEASRGMPGLRSVQEPTLSAEAAAEWRSLQAALSGVGFRPEGWFSLDDFDQTHISPWAHDVHPVTAFVKYSPSGRNFRLRFVRRFPSGGILISSTRLIDLSYLPPQGIYLQARKNASVAELWAWHLEAEALFPDAAGQAPSDPAPGGAQALFVEVAARWARHRRRDRTWLLAVEPFGECWRIYHLTGMPLARQFELGWTIPYWQ